MRKALRIIAVSAGIISVVSTVVLGCIYLEDVLGHINKLKSKLSGRMNEKQSIEDEYECE